MISTGNNLLENIDERIHLAKREARELFKEVEFVRNKTQDSNLLSLSHRISNIPRNYTKLHLYNTLKGHRNKIAKIRWHMDSTRLLSASQDGFMIIWDAVSGLKKQAVNLENQWVLTCDYSPSGRLVASAGLDNACTIYKVKSDSSGIINDQNAYEMYGNIQQSVQSIFKGHRAYVSDCKFVNDASILTSSGDLTCALWDITKGKKARDFIDHISDVLCLSEFPTYIKTDSPLFLSGSSDGYVKAWDVRTQSPTQSFFISNSDVNCTKVFADGYSFIVGSDDGMLRWFDLRSDCDIAVYSLQSQFHNSDSSSKTYRNDYSPTDQVSSNSLSASSTLDSPGVLSVDFSRSGRLIYACYSEFGCLIWDSLKNEIIGSVGNEHLNKINQVAVSPDGIGLATASWDATIKVWAA
ncbi:uncharacterized protein PRCAT00004164001 [Priceomyces carsonii]|uniref:uncharacterized protein n=1 Tax=Priceomyces carsonii TaxID=28549 RepID=UPI002EDA42F7|nr:unnamed protein product [Priceomyces carsonii]